MSREVVRKGMSMLKMVKGLKGDIGTISLVGMTMHC